MVCTHPSTVPVFAGPLLQALDFTRISTRLYDTYIVACQKPSSFIRSGKSSLGDPPMKVDTVHDHVRHLFMAV